MTDHSQVIRNLMKDPLVLAGAPSVCNVHLVLVAVTAARLHSDAQRQVRIRLARRDRAELLVSTSGSIRSDREALRTSAARSVRRIFASDAGIGSTSTSRSSSSSGVGEASKTVGCAGGYVARAIRARVDEKARSRAGGLCWLAVGVLRHFRRPVAGVSVLSTLEHEVK